MIYNPVICYSIINLWNAHDADVFPRWIQHLSEDVAPWKSKIHCRARDFEQFCKFFSPVSNRKMSITVQEVILHKMTNGLNGSIFNHCFYRFIESRIASQNRQIFMKSSEIFGCCRFSARFWKHSTQMWKCCCRQSINIRTTRWWQVRRKAIGYASRIGCVIYQRIKLATLSMVTFHMFWMVIQSCASLKTCPSKICILIFFPVYMTLIYSAVWILKSNHLFQSTETQLLISKIIWSLHSKAFHHMVMSLLLSSIKSFCALFASIPRWVETIVLFLYCLSSLKLCHNCVSVI